MNYSHVVLLIALLLAAGLAGYTVRNRRVNVQTADTAATTTTSTAASATRGTGVGNTAPDFQLARTDGSPVSLADFRGQPTVLVFWTAWCPNCKEEAPRFNQLAAQYEPRGVRVLGIDIQDSISRTEAGIKEFGIRYPVARDPDATVTRRYHVIGTPTVVFLDSNGIVRYFGNELPDDYAAQLDMLLTEKR